MRPGRLATSRDRGAHIREGFEGGARPRFRNSVDFPGSRSTCHPSPGTPADADRSLPSFSPRPTVEGSSVLVDRTAGSPGTPVYDPLADHRPLGHHPRLEVRHGHLRPDRLRPVAQLRGLPFGRRAARPDGDPGRLAAGRAGGRRLGAPLHGPRRPSGDDPAGRRAADQPGAPLCRGRGRPRLPRDVRPGRIGVVPQGRDRHRDARRARGLGLGQGRPPLGAADGQFAPQAGI